MTERWTHGLRIIFLADSGNLAVGGDQGFVDKIIRIHGFVCRYTQTSRSLSGQYLGPFWRYNGLNFYLLWLDHLNEICNILAKYETECYLALQTVS